MGSVETPHATSRLGGRLVSSRQTRDGSESASLPISIPSEHSIKEMQQMAEGFIKKVLDKGFGFIKTMNDKDLFFHSSAVQGVAFNELREGQKVTYTEGRGEKGPCAENVRVV
jgi:CspA family cold shock protein